MKIKINKEAPNDFFHYRYIFVIKSANIGDNKHQITLATIFEKETPFSKYDKFQERDLEK